MIQTVIANSEQVKQISEDLTAFIHRVSLNEKASPAEIAVLPEIAKCLCEVITFK